jgi:hypothetical protein
MTTARIGRRGMCAALAAALVAWSMLAICPAYADDTASQARQIVAKWQNAVIKVRLVIKTSMSTGSNTNQEEQKADISGTVIDPSGLTVVSLTQVDPAEMYRRYMGHQGADEPQFNVETQVTDVKLRFAEGTEVPAKVVLRDKDLDLAFVRPVDKLAQPAAAVDLAQSATPQLLDQVVTVNRLGNYADWAVAPRIDRIQAILSKPRTVFVPQDGDDVGTPAFSLDGKIVGVTLIRLPSTIEASGGMDESGGMAVILPAADIIEGAKQASE